MQLMQLMDSGLGLLLGRKTLLVGRLVAFLLYSTNTLWSISRSVYQRAASVVDQLLVIVERRRRDQPKSRINNITTVSGHCDPLVSVVESVSRVSLYLFSHVYDKNTVDNDDRTKRNQALWIRYTHLAFNT
jgi:hypothetical protein